jgi:hypothetical protein
VTKKSCAISPIFRQGIHFPTSDEKGNVGHAQRQIVYTREKSSDVNIDIKQIILKNQNYITFSSYYKRLERYRPT